MSLLAVFWDDVDLTHGNGRLLYQVRCQYNPQEKEYDIRKEHTVNDKAEHTTASSSLLS